MHPITTEALRASYEQALEHRNAITDRISTDQFSHEYVDAPKWALGPFERDDELTFRQERDWTDPTGIGWTSDSIFNPSMIERDGSLYLFYRASPRKESTSSRIGLAVREPGGDWHDSRANPIVFPTLPNELLGCEDPKVYAAAGRYFLFYNGIWPTTGTDEASTFAPSDEPFGPIGCDINLAVSDDLLRWRKHGPVVPYEVSRLWAKGAVIPRNARGEAVMIGGEYLMFLSEGCGGVAYVGHSADLVEWEFGPQDYLDLSELGGVLHEVACATVVSSTGKDARGDHLVIDFFYSDADGEFAAGQALYSIDDPFAQKAICRGGSLAWGGLLEHGSGWVFGQGWDASAHTREIYFYRAVPSGPHPPGRPALGRHSSSGPTRSSAHPNDHSKEIGHRVDS